MPTTGGLLAPKVTEDFASVEGGMDCPGVVTSEKPLINTIYKWEEKQEGRTMRA